MVWGPYIVEDTAIWVWLKIGVPLLNHPCSWTWGRFPGLQTVFEPTSGSLERNQKLSLLVHRGTQMPVDQTPSLIDA